MIETKIKATKEVGIEGQSRIAEEDKKEETEGRVKAFVFLIITLIIIITLTMIWT